MTLRVIDIETTGVDPTADAVIEIASVDLVRRDDQFAIENERETFVATRTEIPPAASAVHHIVAADLVGAPELRDVIHDFSGASAFVAHNCSFERSFLDAHFGDAKWVCTYRCALRIWPNAPGHSNQVLRYWLGLLTPFGRERDAIAPHRALSDVIVTAAIFGEMARLATWAQMLEWSSQPPLMTWFTFGKHKGERFAEVGLDYLDWIVHKSDLDEGAKFSAKFEIERRAKAKRDRRDEQNDARRAMREPA